VPEFHVYAGFAGDTDAGRFLSSGLYRSRNGCDPWQSIGGGIGVAPEVRALLTDPTRPGWLLAGTQDGIWYSNDAGDSWARASAPAPGLAVWSFARHPRRTNTIFAGYEPAAILRSDDGGRTWRTLAENFDFPDITVRAEMPKRILSIVCDPLDPDDIYAGVEIGGLLRSRNGGVAWANAIDGLYFNEDPVDVHSVAVSPVHRGRVTIATRIGTFRSEDRGDHWRLLPVPLLRPRGTYCRSIGYAPHAPHSLYLSGGNDFDGDVGVLFVSRDDGDHFEQLDLCTPLKTPVFAVAFDANQPESIFCTTKIGQVARSTDRGRSWQVNPLANGLGHVFSLAAG
jgi:photosystem II stability/assembly factor-like uncharacterized protein